MKVVIVLAFVLAEAFGGYLSKDTSYAPAYLYRRYYRPVEYYDSYQQPRVIKSDHSYGPSVYSYEKPYYKVQKEVSYVSKPVVSVKYVKEPVVSYRVRPVKTVSYVKEPVVTYRKTKVVPSYW